MLPASRSGKWLAVVLHRLIVCLLRDFNSSNRAVGCQVVFERYRPLGSDDAGVSQGS